MSKPEGLRTFNGDDPAVGAADDARLRLRVMIEGTDAVISDMDRLVDAIGRLSAALEGLRAIGCPAEVAIAGDLVHVTVRPEG